MAFFKSLSSSRAARRVTTLLVPCILALALPSKARAEAPIFHNEGEDAISARAADVSKRAPPPASATSATTRIVHLKGKDVWLEKRGAGGWELACRAPCDVPLDTAGEYRVNGAIVGKPRSFSLLRTTDSERIVVEAVDTNDAAIGGGIVLMALGAVGFLFGSLLGVAEKLTSDSHSSADAVMIVSGVSVIGGVALLINGLTPTVDQTEAPRPASPRAAQLPSRVPVWNAPSPIAAPRGTALTVPLFHLSF